MATMASTSAAISTPTSDTTAKTMLLVHTQTTMSSSWNSDRDRTPPEQCNSMSNIILESIEEMTSRKPLHSDPVTEPDEEQQEEMCYYEGYLRKRYSSSVYMGSWRYCVLSGPRLRWYMTQERSQLRGEVMIQSIEPWSGQGSVNLYPHAFAIRTTSNRLLLCSAKSAQAKDEWLHALEKAMETKSMKANNHHQNESNTTESRRIVPEDIVRSTNCAESVVPPSKTTQTESSMIGDAQQLASYEECTRCAVRLRTFLSRRIVCGSCDRPFCSRHCRKHVRLHHFASVSNSGRVPSRRCCGFCARRQEFIVYLEALSKFTASIRENDGLEALVRKSSADVEGTELFERTLERLRLGPMSLIKTIKILYQTRKKPHLFRVALERLPFYVENCIDRVESLWYQLLHLFQCCDSDMESSAVQLFYLKRYIRAICRRSPRIALQTIWHVQASIGDATRLHPNSLLSLLGFLYPSSATIWNDLLLADCPDHQRREILEKIDILHRDSEKIIATCSQRASMLERWLNAQSVDEFERSAHEIVQSGIRLCEYQSRIAYESLCVNDDAAANSSQQIENLVSDQVHFVQSLAAVSERLRHVQPRDQRPKQLEFELNHLNATLHASALYPLCTASDELYKVVRIPPTEGKVFSTKMRAPTLVFIETVPVDATNLVGSQERLRPFLSSRGNSTLLDAINQLQQQSTLDQDVALPGQRDSVTSSVPESPSQYRKASNLSAMDSDSLGSSVLGLDEATASSNPPLSASISQFFSKHLPFPNTNTEIGHSPASSCFSRGNGHAAQRLGVENLVYDTKVYGESWEERQERIRRESPMGHLPGWKLFSIIVKTNDDLRQEMFTMQLIHKFQSIFEFEHVDLWLRTYRIVATGANIGLLETITDACSLDHLKKTSDKNGSLVAYFESVYGDRSSASYQRARDNFIKSMAAYSIVCYVLLVKDRHNGNILLSTDGHIIHIDFGFILGIAPGGMFSIEDAPFKLTTEMVDIMGGVQSDGYKHFQALLCSGLLALQKYQSEIAALLQTTGQHSPFPCFEGTKLAKIVADLRDRLCVGLTKKQVEKRVAYLIRRSFNAWGTRQYDAFQLRSNNIHP